MHFPFLKFILPLYKYFLKGARVDASIFSMDRSQGRRDVFPPNPERIIKFVPQDQITTYWNVTIYGELLLKNNSSQTAYRIKISNSSELFDSLHIPNMFSLSGHDKRKLPYS